MPEAYRPGLPVLSDEERLRRNALQQEWMNPFQNESIDQRPSMASLYEDEPTTAELLAQAQGTLDSTADTARQVAGAGEISRRSITPGPQSTEMHAPEPEYGYGDVARDTVVGASIPASFLPGPIGLAAGAIQGIDALAGGNPLGAGLAALPAIRALRGAKGMAPTGAGAKGPFSPFPRAAQDVSVPSRTYQLGPEKSLEDILGSPSIASLRDDIADGAQGGSVDLSDALNSLGETPLPPADVVRARAAERFGRSFRSESTAEPVIAQAGPKVRAFSEGEIRGSDNLGQHLDEVYGPDAVLGPGGRYMSPEEAERLKQVASSLLGANPPASALRSTARQAVEGISDADRAMLRQGGAMFKGKNDDIVEEKLSKWAMAEGEPPLPSAVDEYLIHDMPATDWNKTMFGGSTSSTEGTFGPFVRPKDRTPIGKRPARRGEGDEAIQWNRP